MNLIHYTILNINFATIFANNLLISSEDSENKEKSLLSRSKDRIKQTFVNFTSKSSENLSRCRKCLNEKFGGYEEKKTYSKLNYRRNKEFLNETGIKQNQLKENFKKIRNEAKKPFNRFFSSVFRAYNTSFDNDNDDKRRLMEY